jgi:hypothetical protein
VLTEGQIRHEQTAAGALRPLDGEALRCGVPPQLVGGVRQTGEVQRPFQLCQLCLAVDIDQVIFVLEPVDMHGGVLLAVVHISVSYLARLVTPYRLRIPDRQERSGGHMRSPAAVRHLRATRVPPAYRVCAMRVSSAYHPHITEVSPAYHVFTYVRRPGAASPRIERV